MKHSFRMIMPTRKPVQNIRAHAPHWKPQPQAQPKPQSMLPARKEPHNEPRP
jgi:hypothetical protein